MANKVMNYEATMIFSVLNGEEAVAGLVERFKKLITDNATVDHIDEWGRRRLAYPINDELDGHYLLVEFSSKPDFPAELDRVFNITDGVLRTMIICKEEDKKAAKKQKEVPAAAAEQDNA